MTEQQFCKYLTNRFEDQRNWLDGKSIKYKRWHQHMMVTTIILAGIAPLVTALVPVTAVPVVISGLVSIIASLHQASRFKELWTTYRATSEAHGRGKNTCSRQEFATIEKGNSNRNGHYLSNE